MILKIAFVFIIQALVLCQSYKILVIFGHPGNSHYWVFHQFIEELAARGHEVTVISHHVPNKIENLRHVPLEGSFGINGVVNISDKPLESNVQYMIRLLRSVERFGDESCTTGLPQPNFQKFLRESLEFDVILGELFSTNCYYGLVNKFKAPLIGMTSTTLLDWHLKWFGIDHHPSISNIVSIGGYSKPMNFYEKIENYFAYYISNLWFTFFNHAKSIKYSKQYIGYHPIDPYNISLILTNQHFSFQGPMSLPPNVVEIGGIHVFDKKPNPIPEDLKTWLDEAKNGVIYFSFGSMLRSDSLPTARFSAFLEAFGTLPQRVLWKWNGKLPSNVPKNIRFEKWTLQFEILCHQNVKVFISHGGLLSTTEAVYCGVPIVVIPQFGDQNFNSFNIENNEVGVRLLLENATKKNILEALNKSLHPNTFANMKSMSRRWRDRPQTPLNTAIYWVEHIARHRGAPNMRNPITQMSFIEYYMLDSIVPFISVVIWMLLNYIQ